MATCHSTFPRFHVQKTTTKLIHVYARISATLSNHLDLGHFIVRKFFINLHNIFLHFLHFLQQMIPFCRHLFELRCYRLNLNDGTSILANRRCITTEITAALQKE